MVGGQGRRALSEIARVGDANARLTPLVLGESEASCTEKHDAH